MGFHFACFAVIVGSRRRKIYLCILFLVLYDISVKVSEFLIRVVIFKYFLNMQMCLGYERGGNLSGKSMNSETTILEAGR